MIGLDFLNGCFSPDLPAPAAEAAEAPWGEFESCILICERITKYKGVLELLDGANVSQNFTDYVCYLVYLGIREHHQQFDSTT